ncbi:MAG: hypothetical protein VZQ83_02095 [Eubacterium sp.]|nr:hypothetical protein [Eubacterium sp.]
MSTIIVVVVVVLTVSLAWAYHKKPEEGLYGSAQTVKRESKELLNGFLDKEVARHDFDPTFMPQMACIVADYSAPGMDIDVGPALEEELPLLYVHIVPKQQLTEEELATLLGRLKIKLGRYLLARGLNWRFFGTYAQMPNSVWFRLYYAEGNADYTRLLSKYKIVVKEKCSADVGHLRDDQLDQEMRYIGKDKNRL